MIRDGLLAETLSFRCVVRRESADRKARDVSCASPFWRPFSERADAARGLWEHHVCTDLAQTVTSSLRGTRHPKRACEPCRKPVKRRAPRIHRRRAAPETTREAARPQLPPRSGTDQEHFSGPTRIQTLDTWKPLVETSQAERGVQADRAERRVAPPGQAAASASPRCSSNASTPGIRPRNAV